MKAKMIIIIGRVLLVVLLYQICAPMASYALTSGPTQPEFSSFEPVATTNMVNEFTGAFTYNLPVLNIPGPGGSGYSLSLSYHSGESPEGEASWVGYGWTLNPGAINRNTRGFPDDYNGAKVRYWNKTKTNWTVSVGPKNDLEVFSFDGLKLGASAAIRYNNYKGFGYTAGLDLDYKGLTSLGYSVSDGEGSFSYSVNPAAILSALKEAGKKEGEHQTIRASKRFAFAPENSRYSFAEEIRPTNFTSYSGYSVNFTLAPEFALAFLPIGVETGLSGNFTSQTNSPNPDDLDAYGYMYSGRAANNDAAMMDYYVEKDAPFTKRDRYLGIPFSNADNFSATGEGVGGGFRLYNRKAGHFRPNAKQSNTTIAQLGAELHTGPLNFGAGIDVGVGVHTLSVGKWGDPGGDYQFTPTDDGKYDEPYFFRFNNDLGGSVAFAANDDAASAWNDMSGSIGNKSSNFNLGGRGIYTSMNNGARSGRASYIGYHTNHEMLDVSGKWTPDPPVDPFKHYNSYCKESSARDFVDRTTAGIADGVGEFAITNESGNTCVYGLPVYSRNEKNLQYGLEGTAPGNIKQNYLAVKSITPERADVVVGEERDLPYASTYLLTEILTPDYVDRANDGPTPDDLGGYTKFNYSRVAGSNDKTEADDSWYKWRIPYNGLLYNRNSLSDPNDDAGSVSTGEKEIYYLQSIETKTHIALFVTDTRMDAFEADHDEYSASGVGTTVLPGGTVPNSKQRKLVRIELYAKDNSGNRGALLQTVNFDYDYTLCKGAPNVQGSNRGKLTLRKVWFAYEGAVNARISPYVFGYEYKRSAYYGANVSSTYPDVVGFADHFLTSTTYPWSGIAPQDPQNPDYCAPNIDRWGDYQYDGYSRHAVMNPWINQHPDNNVFDPAAWQLKWIRLPSGGEIHVQYEANDYCYVQDRPAMAMVSLKAPSNGLINKFYLNVADLGIPEAPSGNAELQRLKSLIQKQFKEKDERIFFKMLFPLVGTAANLTNCTSEYITGYAQVHDVGVDADGLYVVLGNATGNGYSTPAEVCRDLFSTSKSGNLRIGPVCDASLAGISNDGDVAGVLTALLGKIGTTLAPASVCPAEYINYGSSYLRVPMTRAKLGGGIRVKRILMYDSGVESGDDALYGTEYLYQTEDGRSSGVALNEPSAGREENPLVTSLAKRTSQGGVERIIAGEDREQFEGPLGESILPGASVGYGRVVVRSIYQGRTNSGFTVDEFYTAKDYPFDMYCSAPSTVSGKAVDNTAPDEVTDWIPTLPLGLVSFGKSNVWATQGYRFVQNAMHGKPHRISSYGGDYADPTKWALSRRQEYEYFAPGEPVPMMYDITDVGRTAFPGKEMEVVFDDRDVEDISVDGNIEVDVSVGIAGIFPILFGSAYPSINYSEKKLHTHVTSKVVRYPAIVKSMTTYQDGIYHRNQNIAFDPATGNPIVIRTTDGYDGLALEQAPLSQNGSYYTYTFPASGQYDEMGQKAINERTVLKSGIDGVTITKFFDGGSHFLSISYTDPLAACLMRGRFTGGDLVRLTSKGDNSFRGVYHVGELSGNRVKLLPTSYGNPSENPSEEVNVEIIRSGRTNQLNADAGSITTYGAPQGVIKHLHP